MSFSQLAVTAMGSVLLGGLMSALLLRSNRKFSVHDGTEGLLVTLIMLITAVILGFSLTYLVGAESWSLPLQGFYTFGLVGVGIIAEDWLESQIGDHDPLKNQNVTQRGGR